VIDETHDYCDHTLSGAILHSGYGCHEVAYTHSKDNGEGISYANTKSDCYEESHSNQEAREEESN
jgi:hypothetical protein